MAGRKSEAAVRLQEQARRDAKRLAKDAAKLPPKEKRKDFTKSADVFAALQEARAGPQARQQPKASSTASLLKL